MSGEISVSVIIPVYNSENTIIAALDSAVYQTYDGIIEIVIVDDGSTDKSATLIFEYIENVCFKNRVIKLLKKTNGGVSSARNSAILKSKGKYIAFLDSDDVWHLDKIKIQVEAMLSRNIKFLGTNRNNQCYPFFGKNKSELYTINLKEMLIKWWPCTPSIIVDRDVVSRVGYFNETLVGAEDGEYWVRILQTGTKLFILNLSLVEIGHGKRAFGESGLSGNLKNMYDGEVYILRKLKASKSISSLEFYGFYTWMTLKYYRRKFISKFF